MIRASYINLLSWFIKKNIFFDISRKEIVLDVGGGDKPFWRANIILDKFPDSKGLSQRFSGMNSVKNKHQVLIEGDAENMPFKNNTFDYVFCSHLLEHVVNPDKVILEIMRIGKRGYIEVPTSWKQKIIDMPSHLWLVSIRDKVLIFEAKKTAQTNDPDYTVMRDIFNKYDFTIDRSDFMTSLFWTKNIKYEVKGSPNLDLLTQSEELENQNNSKKNFFYIYRFLNFLFSKLLFWKTFKGSLSLTEILKCPKCNNSKIISSDKESLKCVGCNYIINAKI